MSKKPIKIKQTDKPFVVFSMEADTDYLLSRWISFSGGGFASRAGFFAQQACEKYMKAVLVQEVSAYPETHNLLELSAECGKHFPYFQEPQTKELLSALDPFDQVGRYGGAANYDPLAQKTPGFETAGEVVWQSRYLDMLDAFVHHVRGLLDHSKVNFRDQFEAILAGDRTARLVASWEGRPPIRVVLTKNNRYFLASTGRRTR